MIEVEWGEPPPPEKPAPQPGQHDWDDPVVVDWHIRWTCARCGLVARTTLYGSALARMEGDPEPTPTVRVRCRVESE